MPANPGQAKRIEKQKKKRAVAQKTRRASYAPPRSSSDGGGAADFAGSDLDEDGMDAAAAHPFARPVDYDELDRRSAEIRKLIRGKRLDEAEKESNALSREFPAQSDGLQRLAEVHEARGDLTRALDTLRLAAKRENLGDTEAQAEIAKKVAKLAAQSAGLR